ncbi:MAG: UvrD-helicase domain-containing protein [Burkholderiales bacterium]
MVAPAGCGKTHLIAETLGVHPRGKPILVLTHTNAGKAALDVRLKRMAISETAYEVKTLDGWALRLISAFPQRSGHDPAILAISQPNRDYPAIRAAALRLLQSGAISEALRATYAGILVDEYQDCLIEQHGLVCAASDVLPTRVLGDPLQAIFGFGNAQLVRWNSDVAARFPAIGELGTPHRWIRSGHPALGEWLLQARAALLSGTDIDLRHVPKEVTWVELDDATAEARRSAAAQTAAAEGGDVLIIGESMNRQGRQDVASRTPGAHVVEPVDLPDFMSFARSFNLADANPLASLARFAGSVMTNLDVPSLLRRVETLRSGKQRREANPAELAALRFLAEPSYNGAALVLHELENQAGVRVYRHVVLRCCKDALRAAAGGVAFPEAAHRERERYRQSGRRLPRRAVGSTLLLKGLEAEVAVVLHPERMDAANLYVALTRAAARLVVCSDEPLLRGR